MAPNPSVSRNRRCLVPVGLLGFLAPALGASGYAWDRNCLSVQRQARMLKGTHLQEEEAAGLSRSPEAPGGAEPHPRPQRWKHVDQYGGARYTSSPVLSFLGDVG